MKLTKIESYEIQAFAFRVMTGYMAPGKDVSPLACEAPYEERCAAWDEWRNKHAHCILAMLHGFEALIDRDDEPTGALLDRLDATERESELLRAALKRANDQAEHFERKWYLRGDENEKLRAALVAAMEIVQQDRVSLYECSRNQATGEIEPEDAAAIAELDAIIAQADTALGSEG